MAAQKFITQSGGGLLEVQANLTSAGAGDAGKLPALDSTGKLDNSFMPTGIGTTTKIIPASEALAAGDFVNIYSNAGTLNCRKADGTAPSKEAHGFVLAAVLSAGNATIYFSGLNTAQTGLTIGVMSYLSGSTPGRATATVPSTTGNIVQKLGIANSTTEMEVNIQQTIQLA